MKIGRGRRISRREHVTLKELANYIYPNEPDPKLVKLRELSALERSVIETRAVNMGIAGFSNADIAYCTGLNVNVVAQLVEKHKNGRR